MFTRYIKPALVKCGLGHIYYQAMRRTCSTQQAAAKVDAKTRSDILGHSVVVDENEYVQTSF